MKTFLSYRCLIITNIIKLIMFLLFVIISNANNPYIDFPVFMMGFMPTSIMSFLALASYEDFALVCFIGLIVTSFLWLAIIVLTFLGIKQPCAKNITVILTFVATCIDFLLPIIFSSWELKISVMIFSFIIFSLCIKSFFDLKYKSN